jgi:hypothetical protein
MQQVLEGSFPASGLMQHHSNPLLFCETGLHLIPQSESSQLGYGVKVFLERHLSSRESVFSLHLFFLFSLEFTFAIQSLANSDPSSS